MRHHDTLGRRVVGKDREKKIEEVPGDFWPQWHAKSGKVLGLGTTFRYLHDSGPMRNAKADTCYSTYDPERRAWSPLALLEMPQGELSDAARAACVQRYDLPNGDILLPVYFNVGGRVSPQRRRTGQSVHMCKVIIGGKSARMLGLTPNNR